MKKQVKRSRNRELKVFLSDDEYRILLGKCRAANMRSKSFFIRQLILDGFVYYVDYKELRKFNDLLSNAACNINQIAHKTNATENIYQKDIEQLQKEVENIWHIHESILSKIAYGEL